MVTYTGKNFGINFFILVRYVYVLLLMLSMNIFGCAGIQYTDRVQAIDITQMDKQEITTRVLAVAEEWRNSGAILKKGLKYKIMATGGWTVGPMCGLTGPDGIGISPLCNMAPTSNITDGGSGSMLIGKIGESGVPFPIGSNIERIAAEEGVLFLRINELPGIAGDNSGFIDVTLSLQDADKKKDALPLQAAV
jgi:hypothetical protein